MINLEFETFEEISETLNIVSDTIDSALNNDEKIVDLNINGIEYTINTESSLFKAGLLYGLSIAKDIATQR